MTLSEVFQRRREARNRHLPVTRGPFPVPALSESRVPDFENPFLEWGVSMIAERSSA